MSLPNDSATLPATGTVVATHIVSSKEYQAVVLADADGHLRGSNAVYRMTVIGSAVGANKVHCDLFNADASLVVKVLSAKAMPEIDTAVTGTVAAEIGTGGTAHTNDNTALSGISISRFDTASAALDADITARLGPTGGATAGAILGVRHVFMEETNAGAALAAMQGAEFINPDYPVYLRQNQGLRFVQGGVASVGTLNFEITFEVVA